MVLTLKVYMARAYVLVPFYPWFNFFEFSVICYNDASGQVVRIEQ